MVCVFAFEVQWMNNKTVVVVVGVGVEDLSLWIQRLQQHSHFIQESKAQRD